MVEAVTAARNGDRSENGDYIYGKRRLREIDRRIRFLSTRLKGAEVVDLKRRRSWTRSFSARRSSMPTSARQEPLQSSAPRSRLQDSPGIHSRFVVCRRSANRGACTRGARDPLKQKLYFATVDSVALHEKVDQGIVNQLGSEHPAMSITSLLG